MKLLKVSWRNFKSYSNVLTEIDFSDQSSLNLIVGANGTGKSSIAEVIIYSLFGKLDNFKQAEIPNRINKNFYSKIELDCNGHRIIIERGLTPSLFEVNIDGKKLDTAGKTNVQQMLEEEWFKIPFSVFKNTIVLSISDFKSLMDLNATDKRNIIDKIFGFTIYNQMNKILKEENKKIKELASTTVSDEEIVELEKKIKEIEKLQSQNDEIMNKIRNIKSDLDKSTTDKSHEYRDLKRRIEEIDAKIKFIDTGRCPKCGSSLKTPEFDEERQNLIDERKECVEKQNLIKDTLLGIKSKLNALGKKETSTRNDSKTDEILDLKSDKKSVKETNVSQHLKLKDEMSETIQSLQDEKVKLDEQKEVMDVLMTMFSENGIKTYIAAKYIPIINNIISEILDYMELNYRVKFDEKFDGGITLNGYNVNYSTLSAGEKKRIDFACVISIIKFLKLQIGELNLLFLD